MLAGVAESPPGARRGQRSGFSARPVRTCGHRGGPGVRRRSPCGVGRRAGPPPGCPSGPSEQPRVAAPRPAHDDLLGVGKGDRGRDHPGQGAGDGPGACRPVRAVYRRDAPIRRSTSIAVESRAGAGRAAANTSVKGIAPAAGAGGDQVGDLAGQAGVAAPDLAVADDRAAESLAEIDVGEVVAARAPASRSARAAQLTSLSTVTVRRRAARARSTGSSSPTRNGASGRWTSRPVARSTGSAALTTRQPERSADRRRPPRPRLAAPRATSCAAGALGRARPGCSRDRRRRASTRSATTPFGGDADGQGGARRRRRGRSTSRPGRGRWCARRCRPRARLGQPAHALPDRRLGDAGLGGELGPGQPAGCMSARRTCSSVSERSSSSEGLAGVTRRF